MERPLSFGAGGDSLGGGEGDESRASWAQVDPQGECLQFFKERLVRDLTHLWFYRV